MFLVSCICGILRDQYPNDLDYHVKKADRSECPHSRDFNKLYIKYKFNAYGGKNGDEMFECLEKKLEMEDITYRYRAYDEDKEEALVLVFQTTLMKRICHMVRRCI